MTKGGLDSRFGENDRGVRMVGIDGIEIATHTACARNDTENGNDSVEWISHFGLRQRLEPTMRFFRHCIPSK